MITICLYLSISNFVIFLNNGSSVYMKIKFTVAPDQYDAKCP